MPGEQPVVYVTAGDDLKTLVEAAVPGTTFVLEGGDHGALTLSDIQNDPDNPITLVSADPDDPAVFSNLTLKNAQGITFEGVVFDYSFDPAKGTGEAVVELRDCADITLSNVTMDGDVAQGVSAAADGYPTGYGLRASRCSGVTLEHSEIQGFYKGVIFDQGTDLTVQGNDLHTIRSDGMNFINVHGVAIEDNHIHDFKKSESSGDHADFIQFWTNGQTQASSDIVIRGNFLDTGDGGWTQSIFMRNEEVDNGRAGSEMYYQNVLIEENVIVNAHLHGILVGATDGLVVRNNSLFQSASASAGMDPNVSQPQIRVWSESTNVQVTDNVATGYLLGAGPEWTLGNNLILDPTTPEGPLSYAENFYNPQALTEGDLASLVARPDGLVASSGAGASVLQYDPANAPGADGLNALADLSFADGTANQLQALAGASQGDPLDLLVADYSWDFGDGTTGQGRDVSHVYAAAGVYDVTLNVTLSDGTSDTFRQSVTVVAPDVLRFDNTSGQWIWADGTIDMAGVVGVDATPAPGQSAGDTTTPLAFEIGDGHGNRSIDKAVIEPFFGTDVFDLSMTLQALPGGTAGEVLRIHDNLVLSVLSDGSLRADVFPDTGERLRLDSSGTDLFDGGWHHVSLRFDGASDQVILEVDGTGTTALGTAGSIKGMGAHGLVFGNPWGKANFDGLVRDFTLTASSDVMVAPGDLPPPQDDTLDEGNLWLPGTFVDPTLWTDFAGEVLGDETQAQGILSDTLSGPALETVYIADLPQQAATETRLGRIETFEDETHVGISLTLSGLEDMIGANTQRVLWNHMKYGIEISEQGLGLRIGVQDQGMKSFWVDADEFNFDLTQDQQLTAELDAEADVARLWLGTELVLDISGYDLVFGEADAYQWGYSLGGGMGRVFKGTVEEAQLWSYEDSPFDLLL